MKETTLPIVSDTPEDFDALEEYIQNLFRQTVYLPLMRELGPRSVTLQNASDDLISAITKGKIYFDRGAFRGPLNAKISRELRRIGAKRDPKTHLYTMPKGDLPMDVRTALSTSKSAFDRVLERITDKIQQILPSEVAEKFEAQKLFDSALFKTEKKLSKSFEGIIVKPKLSKDQRAKIADDYSKSLKLPIKDFVQEETEKLRAKIQKRVLRGERYEGLTESIQESYGVSLRKAKFLAHQETRLMVTSFTESRYQAAGLDDYFWECVAGSKNHPVRPMHKKLDGTRQKFSKPPIVNAKGERKNPGKDYGCRCRARVIVKL